MRPPSSTVYDKLDTAYMLISQHQITPQSLEFIRIGKDTLKRWEKNPHFSYPEEKLQAIEFFKTS